MNFKDWLENNCADEGFLQDWYQSSVDKSNPVWTDEHISELMNDFYVVPKDRISKVCKNEIGVLVEGGYIRATAAQDKNYPGIFGLIQMTRIILTRLSLQAFHKD